MCSPERMSSNTDVYKQDEDALTMHNEDGVYICI